jgi:hypothetical protein
MYVWPLLFRLASFRGGFAIFDPMGSIYGPHAGSLWGHQDLTPPIFYIFSNIF